jgi:hypothetical protein
LAAPVYPVAFAAPGGLARCCDALMPQRFPDFPWSGPLMTALSIPLFAYLSVQRWQVQLGCLLVSLGIEHIRMSTRGWRVCVVVVVYWEDETDGRVVRIAWRTHRSRPIWDLRITAFAMTK